MPWGVKLKDHSTEQNGSGVLVNFPSSRNLFILFSWKFGAEIISFVQTLKLGVEREEEETQSQFVIQQIND